MQPKSLQTKLKTLPKQPGVYFYKDKSSAIIYIGKAADLRNRVSQYFQKSRRRDIKTDTLIKEIYDMDWVVTDSEIGALFLESEMIKRYMPKYNIDLRDDKHYQYARIDFKDKHPTVQIVRRPLDDGAEYFGPYVSSIRPALKLLRRIFPFDYKKSPKSRRPTLDYYLGLSPGLEGGKGNITEYKKNLKKLSMYLKGERTKLEKTIELEMKRAAKQADFETAARRRDQLRAMGNLKRQVIFKDQETFDVSRDQALNGLADLLELNGAPRRIEGYDISHMSGTDNVASMVVFIDGLPNKQEYRKFKMRIKGNDDFAHMREALTRRFSGKNLEEWAKPDLLVIDGGKGQVSAAVNAQSDLGISIPTIGLAKRFEEIIVPRGSGEYKTILLPRDSHILKLIMRIRDESHRFALGYHSYLKSKRQTASVLDEIPGIGPATRKKLLKSFGSVKGILLARDKTLEKAIGPKKTAAIKQHLGNLKS